jgi:predicted RNA binding protein YcfA (HicA-like mRNA interferase family)
MALLPVVRGHEAIRAFARAGFNLDHWRGDHAILYHPDGRHLSVPGGGKELKPGTLRALIRGAGLTVEEFVTLLRE